MSYCILAPWLLYRALATQPHLQPLMQPTSRVLSPCTDFFERRRYAEWSECCTNHRLNALAASTALRTLSEDDELYLVQSLQ
jgi:hypothetical protein